LHLVLCLLMHSLAHKHYAAATESCPVYVSMHLMSQKNSGKVFQLQLLDEAAESGRVVEMENLFSRLTLDIIGKAVFDYDFDSLTHDDPVIQVR